MTGRNFTKEFKLQVVQEMLSGRPVAELCREHNIYASLACRWRKEHQQNPELAFEGRGNPSSEDAKYAQLERKIGQQAMEIDFIKRVNTVLQQKLVESKKKDGGEANAVRTNQS